MNALNTFFCICGEEFPKYLNAIKEDELYAAAREMGGEVSGEHGIGHAKRGFLRESMGDVQMNLMRGIKAAFDPKGILNPGKVV